MLQPPRRQSNHVPVDDGKTGAADLRIDLGPSLGLTPRGFLEDIASHICPHKRAAHSSGLLPRHFHLSNRCVWRVKSPVLRSGRLILSKGLRCGGMVGAQMAGCVGGFGNPRERAMASSPQPEEELNLDAVRQARIARFHDGAGVG